MTIWQWFGVVLAVMLGASMGHYLIVGVDAVWRAIYERATRGKREQAYREAEVDLALTVERDRARLLDLMAGDVAISEEDRARLLADFDQKTGRARAQTLDAIRQNLDLPPLAEKGA